MELASWVQMGEIKLHQVGLLTNSSDPDHQFSTCLNSVTFKQPQFVRMHIWCGYWCEKHILDEHCLLPSMFQREQ
jgi:hypothetical protein